MQQADELVPVLVPSMFFFLSLMFITGTAVAAADRQYSVVLGVVLGIFAPLGLLIVILLPPRGTEIEQEQAAEGARP